MTTRRAQKCQHGRRKHESSTTCRHCQRHVCWRHYVERKPWSGCKECDEKQRAQSRAK